MRFVPGGWVSGGAGWGAAAMLALAGCTGEPAPIVTELPSASPSPSTSPAASASASPPPSPLTDAEVLALLPDGAERTDLWGAMVTAQFFLEQYAPMFHTGDTRLWEALSADGCEYCANALENAERVRDEGWTARGGEIVVDRNTIRGTLELSGAAPVSFEASILASRLVAADGTETETGSARTSLFGVVLRHEGQVWRIQEVQAGDA